MGREAHVLIAPGATHSFIANRVAPGTDRVPDRLPETLVVTTPMADSYAIEHIYKQCEAQIRGHTFLMDLMPHDFDADGLA